MEQLFTLWTTRGTPVRIELGWGEACCFVPILGGAVDGPLLHGTASRMPDGDWLSVRSDGSVHLTIRLMLLTDDGVSILLSCATRDPRNDGHVAARMVVRVSSRDPRYHWLNGIEALAVSELGCAAAVYQVVMP